MLENSYFIYGRANSVHEKVAASLVHMTLFVRQQFNQEQVPVSKQGLTLSVKNGNALSNERLLKV